MRQSRKHILLIFPLLLVLAEAISYLGNDMYLPALPQITTNFHTTHSLVQLSLSVWFLGGATTQLFLGPLSDRYGRRPVLLIGLLVFIVASVLCAMSVNIQMLIFARFFQGLTVSAIVVPGYAVIHEVLERKQVIKTIAWMNSIIVLAPAFGPMLGAFALFFGNWRLIFWLLAIWQFVIMLALYRFMPESTSKENRTNIHIKVIIKNYINILMNVDFFLNTTIFSTLFSVLIVWIVSGPFLVMHTFHYTPLAYASFQAIVFSGFILATLLIKPIMNHLEPHRIINIGLVIVTCSALAAMLVAYVMPHELLYLVFAMMVYAFGSGLCLAPLNRLAIEACQEPMGARTAMFSCIMTVSAFIATVFVSILYTGTLISIARAILVAAIVVGIMKGLLTLYHYKKSSLHNT